MAMSLARGIRKLKVWLRQLRAGPLVIRRPPAVRNDRQGKGILGIAIPEHGNGKRDDLVKIPSSTLENWLPAQPSASRCKDFVQLREILSLETVERLILKNFFERNSNPVRWLDLCCGKGSVLGHIKSTLGVRCKNLHFAGVDISGEFIDECKKQASSLQLDTALNSVEFSVHDLGSSPLPAKIGQFDVVTMLNVLHEIPPASLFDFLWAAIDRCKPHGSVILIDMEILPHLEWGAIPWSRHQLVELLAILIKPEFQGSIQDAILANTYPRMVPVIRIEVPKALIDMQRLREASSRNEIREAFQKKVFTLLRRMLKETAAVIETVENVEYPRQLTNSDEAYEIYDANLRFLPQHLWKHFAVSSALRGGRRPGI